MGVRMSNRGTLVAMASLVGWLGCGQSDPAPGNLGESTVPEVLYLVHNEVRAIRLDGTARRSLGPVGDDKRRTGFPRFLPDGRVVVLGDETGGIFPYVGAHEGGTFMRLPMTNVTLHDSLCGVSVGGEPRLVFTTTPFVPTRTLLQRVNVDDPRLEPVDVQQDGVIVNPAPYDEGRVVIAREVGAVTSIEIVDVAGAAYEKGSSVRLASIDLPYIAASPSRLSDGRVVFLLIDTRPDFDLPVGDVWVIELDGTVHATGITRVIAVEAVGNQVVYEANGADGWSDLIATDLVHAPSNITHTSDVNEHLGWSD